MALVFAVPLTIVASLIDEDNGGLRALLFFGAVLGFIIGAGCAAWVQRVGTPLSHGVLTASGTYLAAQAVFVTLALVRGSNVNWFSVFFILMIIAGAGLIGGVLGNRLQQRGITPSARR